MLDSLSVLLALEQGSGASGTTLVDDIRESLARLASGGASVHLQWVPGHAGIPGNEAVDEIAKRGTELPQAGVPIPLGVAQAAIRRYAASRWQQAYEGAARLAGDSSSLAWHAACTARRLPMRPPINLPRRGERLLCQLRVDRCPALRGYLRIIGATDDSTCRACGESEETARHLLMHCPALDAHRCRLWGPNPEPAAFFSEPLERAFDFLGMAGVL